MNGAPIPERGVFWGMVIKSLSLGRFEILYRHLNGESPQAVICVNSRAEGKAEDRNLGVSMFIRNLSHRLQ